MRDNRKSLALDSTMFPDNNKANNKPHLDFHMQVTYFSEMKDAIRFRMCQCMLSS